MRLLATCFALAIAVGLALVPMVATAQDRPRTVMDMLFGEEGGSSGSDGSEEPAQAAPAPEPQSSVTPDTDASARRATQSAAEAADAAESAQGETAGPADDAPAETAASTDETGSSEGTGDASDEAASEEAPSGTQTVLVIGDFMADSLATGLSDLYAEEENVEIVTRVNGSSGLVRSDFYDWPGEIGSIIEEVEPSALLVMLGSNDRQPIREGGTSHQPRSDSWTEIYTDRIQTIAETASDRDVPLIWVGMPAFKFSRMSEDMVYLNDLFRTTVGGENGTFVDVWDGFVDENDQFVYSGPDVSGRRVQLRSSDGITMTAAGGDKLAFFANKALARVIGEAEDSSTGSDTVASQGSVQGPPLPPGQADNATSTPVMALADPAFDGGETLLGEASAQPVSQTASPREELVLRGQPSGSVSGRADNFAWSSKTGSVTAQGPPIAYRGSLSLDDVRDQTGITPPEEMPTILDAIMNEWQADSAAATAGN